MCRSRIIAIEGIPSCSALVIAMYRDKNGVDFVEMHAWHKDPDGKMIFQVEQLCFYDDEKAENFIKHYPFDEAVKWVGNFYVNEILAPSVLPDIPKV